MTDSQHEVERPSDDDLIAQLLAGESRLAWMGNLPADVYCPVLGHAARRRRELLNDINRKTTPEGK